MAYRVTREACEGDDAERRFVLADRAECEKIVAYEIAVARDDQRAGNQDVQFRLAFERIDDLTNLDAAQLMIKDDCSNNHDAEADRYADPASGNAAEKRLGAGTRCCEGDKKSPKHESPRQNPITP